MAYIIQATSQYGKENIDTAKDRTEAEYLTEEYQLAFGSSVRVTYREAKSANRKRRPL
jgi:hypothetical protein